MPATSRVAAAVAAGYLLGRTKKLKLAITVGSLLAGRKLAGGGNTTALLHSLTENPEMKKLEDQLRGRLMEAAKMAAVNVATSRVEAITASLREGAQKDASESEGAEEDQGAQESQGAEQPEGGQESQGDRSEGAQDESSGDTGAESAQSAQSAQSTEEDSQEEPSAPPVKKAAAKKAPAKKAPAAAKTARKAPAAAKKVAAKRPTSGARG